MRALTQLLFGAMASAVICTGAIAADLDPAAIAFTLPDKIEWKGTGLSRQAIMSGDPSKPGPYIVIQKWLPGGMSRPHFHPNDRFITVLSGTWWVGTGTKFDPELTVPMPAGAVVTHFAGKIHFDGAKDEAAVLEIVGMGPATLTDAEVK